MLVGDSLVASEIWDASEFTSDLVVDKELIHAKVTQDSRLDISREALTGFAQCLLSLVWTC